MAVFPGLQLLEPTEAEGYLIAAKGSLEGAMPLAKIVPMPVFAITLLCGHACEAALKSILSKSGVSANVLSRTPYSHNLLNLWQSIEDKGFLLPNPQPDWVSQLHHVYDKPFHLRYPLGFHAIALPNQDAMLKGTETVVELAVSVVR